MFNVECLMFKEIKIMKALRYLLITFAVMTVISVSAQSLAQQPTTEFHSTSSMVGSGTTLPMAVEDGAFTTYDVNAAGRSNKAGLRNGWGGGGEPGDWDEPWADPIGDAALPLAMCALAYLIIRVARRRKRA